ncbi:ca2+:h+ antiporter protein [Rutstroemia sp. NJR-2017a BBW]|nr:ca2+:h+ antiporter protein [Rutstroemia sp. NJR-2017a BBW]
MLLRILLITSIAIVTDDRRRRFQKKSIAISLSKHLGIAVTGLLIPTTLTMATSPTASDINKQSRGVSVVLLSLYCLYLYSEWKTYVLLGLQAAETEKRAKEAREAKERAEKGSSLAFGLAYTGFVATAFTRPKTESAERARPSTPQVRGPEPTIFNPYEEEEEEEERRPQLHFWISITMLLVMGVLLALHVLFISDSIQGSAEETGLSLEGLQTILFMMPLLVLVSWCAGIEDMNLLFQPFEVTVLFPAVVVVQASIEEK